MFNKTCFRNSKSFSWPNLIDIKIVKKFIISTSSKAKIYKLILDKGYNFLKNKLKINKMKNGRFDIIFTIYFYQIYSFYKKLFASEFEPIYYI